MKRRNLIFLLGGASSGAMGVGTGAFSTVEAERGVSVDVVDDSKAFVGYRSDDRTVPNDTNDDGTVDLVTVTNRFAQKIEVVDAAIDDGSECFGEPSVPDGEFEPGQSARITAKPSLEPGEQVDVAVTISVEAAGVSAEVFGDTETREFTVEQAAGTSSLVRYNGGGTINVGSPNQIGDAIAVTVYRIPNGNPSEEAKRNSLSSPETVAIELGKNQNLSGRVVAVEVDGVIHQHPDWNESACAFSGSGGGDGVVVDDPPSC